VPTSQRDTSAISSRPFKHFSALVHYSVINIITPSHPSHRIALHHNHRITSYPSHCIQGSTGQQGYSVLVAPPPSARLWRNHCQSHVSTPNRWISTYCLNTSYFTFLGILVISSMLYLIRDLSIIYWRRLVQLMCTHKQDI